MVEISVASTKRWQCLAQFCSVTSRGRAIKNQSLNLMFGEGNDLQYKSFVNHREKNNLGRLPGAVKEDKTGHIVICNEEIGKNRSNDSVGNLFKRGLGFSTAKSFFSSQRWIAKAYPWEEPVCSNHMRFASAHRKNSV
ncbi:hypothetical protein TNCV_3871651 [Trichonephila clavipes]|nr:hypothetical protein TNCV_3871651 [Trichonephila clavipes]